MDIYSFQIGDQYIGGDYTSENAVIKAVIKVMDSNMHLGEQTFKIYRIKITNGTARRTKIGTIRYEWQSESLVYAKGKEAFRVGRSGQLYKY